MPNSFLKAHRCAMFPEDECWERTGLPLSESDRPRWPEMKLHLEEQDTSLPGWQALLRMVDAAIADRRSLFSPRAELKPELWTQVVTLPPSIAGLKHVKTLDLYGSGLLRIPPEIGEMERLEEFIPYTSYGLHWFPYEITRCRRLRESTVSTRALYGNRKHRPPFPFLDDVVMELVTPRCSVCNAPTDARLIVQFWISLRVATDVLPLLVNACSRACLERLPKPAENYVPTPHRGGLKITQPPTEWEMWSAKRAGSDTPREGP